MYYKHLISLPAFAILAACGESSGGDNGGEIDPDVNQSFAQLQALETNLIDEIVAAGPTIGDDIPDDGGSTYVGTMAFTLQDGSMDGVIGQAEVVADFVSGGITGGATNFYDLDGNATAGSVAFENAANATVLGNLIVGEVNGNITFGSGPMDIATTLAGNFSGPNAEYVSGVMSGTATPDGGGAILVEGAVYAEE